MTIQNLSDFSELTPDRILSVVEKKTGLLMTGLTYPMPSYINRVYELETGDGERIIVKFYRQGRWTNEAICDEHRFIADCASDEIPVVTPLPFSDGSTLAEVDGFRFSIFPKRGGRQFDIYDDEGWRRIGLLVARMHVAGSIGSSDYRIRMNPELSTAQDIAYLEKSGSIHPNHTKTFREVTSRIMDTIADRFRDVEYIRIHGDFHRGNLLERPGEGLMVIDFDDMATGPPVQDLWLLMPDHAGNCMREINLVLEGYTQIRDFDRKTIRLIEPLRAMRMIYFLAWCARQRHDYNFMHNFSDWGTDTFWAREVSALSLQLRAILEHDAMTSYDNPFYVSSNMGLT